MEIRERDAKNGHYDIYIDERRIYRIRGNPEELCVHHENGESTKDFESLQASFAYITSRHFIEPKPTYLRTKDGDGDFMYAKFRDCFYNAYKRSIDELCTIDEFDIVDTIDDNFPHLVLDESDCLEFISKYLESKK